MASENYTDLKQAKDDLAKAREDVTEAKARVTDAAERKEKAKAAVLADKVDE